MQNSEDRLDAREISRDLDTALIGCRVICFDSLDSTNAYAKKLALEGCHSGTVVVANHQTSGKGRLGRNWDSPAGKGIFLSVVLRPAVTPTEAQIYTLASAVAATDTLKKSTGIAAGIKWPNDIVIGGRKVCGILLEISSEKDLVKHIVLGIGINHSQNIEDFPQNIRDTAISLKMAGIGSLPGRTEIIRSLLRELDAAYRLTVFNAAQILDMWYENSLTIGKEVSFALGGVKYFGTATALTPEGHLMVECSDGVCRKLFSGEVSVRGIYGYV